MACCRRTRTYACRWLYYLFLAVGLVLSCLTVTSCRFVDVENPDDVGHEFERVGLFRNYDADADNCQAHASNLSYTTSENGARMGAVVAPLLAAFAFWLIAMESCCGGCCKRCLRYLVAFCLLLAVVFEGLTFLWLGSEVCGGDWYQEVTTQKPCTIDEGAIFAAVATSFFFICLFFLSWIPSPYEKKKVDEDEKDGLMTDKTKNITATAEFDNDSA